jgi:hypothetical protein
VHENPPGRFGAFVFFMLGSLAVTYRQKQVVILRLASTECSSTVLLVAEGECGCREAEVFIILEAVSSEVLSGAKYHDL